VPEVPKGPGEPPQCGVSGSGHQRTCEQKFLVSVVHAELNLHYGSSVRIEDVTPWVAGRGACVSSVSLSEAFDAYLCRLPWAGHGLDWRGIAHRTLKLGGVTDDDAVEWARQTPLATHDHVLLIDSAAEPGVVCRFEDAIRDFELLSTRPELYMCGVDLETGVPRPSFEHLIERRSFMTLNARL